MRLQCQNGLTYYAGLSRTNPASLMLLSAVVITRNEASNIVECLQCLDFADEVVVLDNGSTDGTRELARSLGAKVFEAADWPGFGIQKNRALDLSTGTWVLSIDADERVSADLRQAILKVISGDAPDVFRFPRLSSYCGQYMRHSGWYPDHVVRLFRRGAARFSEDLVHERLLVNGAVGLIDVPLLHLSFPNFESVLDKVNRYSSAGALGTKKKMQSASLGGAICRGAWAFFRTYVLRLGFLDGQMGLALAISNAEGTYYRYAKRWLMLREQAKTKSPGVSP